MRLACLLLLSAGCLDPVEDTLVVDERFEAPVGERWTVTGTVAQPATIHPAEHGLQFVEAATLSTGLAIAIHDDFDDGHWLEYSSSCTSAAELWAQQVSDTAWEVWVDLAMSDDGTPDEFERVHANLPPLPRVDDWNTPTTIGALHLTSEGGPCVIDNLRVFLPAPELGY
jgi:hypothetical protein